MRLKSGVGLAWILALIVLVKSVAAPLPVQFLDITRQAGILFIHNNGASGKKYLPETLGSGAAFLDFNDDGFQDVLLINGRDWTPSSKKTTSKLYRNNGNGTFTDVTAGSGLDIPTYGMGIAAADYDND